MTYEQAAPGTEGAIYALSSITTAKVRRGQVVLVHGAIGSAAVQLLKVLGAQVTATCDTRRMEHRYVETGRKIGSVVIDVVPASS